MFNDLISAIQGKKSDNPKKEFSKKSDLEFLKFNVDGEYRLRILPNRQNPNAAPFEKVFLHYGYKDPNTNKNTVYRCFGKDCPLCEDVQDRLDNHDLTANKNRVSINYLYYMLDQEDGRIKIASIPQYIQSMIEQEIVPILSAGHNPMDYKNGFDMIVKKSTFRKKSTYQVTFDENSSIVFDDVVEQYNNLPDLQKIHKKKEIEQAKKATKLAM